MPVTAPVTEIGYTLAPSYNRMPFDDGETTPELVWPQSIYVYDAMRKQDAQVGSVLRAVTETLLRTPWRIDPAGAKARVTKFVADDLGLPIVGKNPTPPPRLKDRFSWPSHLREALLMLPMGHAYFEQCYRITDDGKAAHLRKLAYRPAKTIEQINVASDGGLISIQQYWTAKDREPKPIPVDHLVAYIHAKEGANWLGTSILRNCYKNWLLKDRLLRVQAQTIERNGMGIPLYTAAETETDLTKGLGMATSWRAGEAAGSAVPFGATLKLVGVEGTLPDAMPVVEYHDSQIARAVLAHFLNLGQQTGSWALGTTFADFFTMSLQTLAEQIRDTATQHIVEDLVDHNFGQDEPAPRLVFDEIGSRQAATAQAIKTLVDAGVIHPDQVLEESSRQQYGLPPADPATATLPPGAAGATPPAPTQMGDTSPSVQAKSAPKGPAAQAADDDGLFPLPAVRAAFNKDQARDPGGEDGGQWVSGPGGKAAGALKDALKLAGKIDLADGETLLGSAKVDGEAGGIRMALIDRGGKKYLRLGVGSEGYGKRNRDEGVQAWDGNPDAEGLTEAEHARLSTESDELDSEYDSASPDRREEIDARQDEIRDQLAADEVSFNGTAELDEYSIRRLADRIRPVIDEAVDQEINELEADADLDLMKSGGVLPDRLKGPDALADLERILARVEPIVFAKGIVPGSALGDVHWSVELDDPTVGAYLMMGVAPEGFDDDYGDEDEDWQGRFDYVETRKFLRLLDQFKGVQAAAGAIDEEADEWEEAIAALVAALAELSGEVLATFDGSKHPRGAGGRFRSTVDKLKDAIKTHRSAGGKGDPFADYDREQLRRAAKTRGITLGRGEDRDSIAQKLLDDLHKDEPAPAVEPPKKTATKRAPRKKAEPKPAPEPKPEPVVRPAPRKRTPKATPPPKQAPAAVRKPAGEYKGPLFKFSSDQRRRKADELTDLMAKTKVSGYDYQRAQREQQLEDELELSRAERGHIEQQALITANVEWWRRLNAEKTSDSSLKADMERRSRAAWAGKPVAVRVTPGALTSILAEGRLKSQFETNTSKGLLDPGLRGAMEDRWFGLPERGTDPKTRPIYGYVAVDGIRPGRGNGGEEYLDQYGDIQVILKDSVRDRTTAMWGDSLNQPDFGIPEPLDNPTWRSYTLAPAAIASGALVNLERDVNGREWRDHNFVEAQIHGGVATGDIAEVVFGAEPAKTVRDMLDGAGITWRVL